VVLRDDLITEVRLNVSGSPGATVQALTCGSVRDSTVLDENGRGSLVVRPTLVQLLRDTRIELRYIAGDEVGAAAGPRISSLI
jgi:hypothetical protein